MPPERPAPKARIASASPPQTWHWVVPSHLWQAVRTPGATSSLPVPRHTQHIPEPQQPAQSAPTAASRTRRAPRARGGGGGGGGAGRAGAATGGRGPPVRRPAARRLAPPRAEIENEPIGSEPPPGSVGCRGFRLRRI